MLPWKGSIAATYAIGSSPTRPALTSPLPRKPVRSNWVSSPVPTSLRTHSRFASSKYSQVTPSSDAKSSESRSEPGIRPAFFSAPWIMRKWLSSMVSIGHSSAACTSSGWVKITTGSTAWTSACATIGTPTIWSRSVRVKWPTRSRCMPVARPT